MASTRQRMYSQSAPALHRNGGVPSRNGNAPRKPFLDQIDPSIYKIIARGGPKKSQPRISVIVPARDRREMLADTLQALATQDIPAGAYEIIVVDDASQDGTAELLKAAARHSEIPLTAAQMLKSSGPAVARNVGITLARGDILAFTDSDCIPEAAWLRSCALNLGPEVGLVQGYTTAPNGERQPLFNHFIEVTEIDGRFATANICYRKQAVVDAGGFDPGCDYWEDVDLGWRVLRLGWKAAFASEAVVRHRVMPMTAMGWLKHATRFYNLPVITSRYPEFRKHLFMGVWASPSNVLFEMFVAGLALGAFKRPLLLMTIPYLVSFPLRGRLVGRVPPLRAAAHIARDAVSLGALVAGSLRSRRPVL